MSKLNHKLAIFLLVSGLSISILTGIPPTRVSAQDALTQLARTNDGSLSVRIPAQWSFVESPAPFYAAVLVFGDSPAAIQTITTLDLQSKSATLTGRAGLVAIVNPALYQGIPAGQEAALLVQSLIQAAQTVGTQILGEQRATFADGASGTLASYANTAFNSKGVAAVMVMNNQIVVIDMMTTAQTFDANQDLISAIQQTVHVPAESVVATSVLPRPATAVAPALPTVSATAIGTMSATQPAGTEAAGTVGLPGIAALPGQTVSVDNGSFSVVLPQGWVSTSVATAAQKAFIFGSTSPGRDTRLQAFQSSQPGSVQIQDSGGLVLLFAPADLKATSPVDPVALLNSQLQQGNVKVVEAVQKFQVNSNAGAYAVIDTGNQRGFIALIAFSDKIAYVTATSTPDGFDANRASLLAILQSVRVPAETSGNGLPGLTGK